MPWWLGCEGQRHQVLGVGATEAGGQPVDTRQFSELPPLKDPPYPQPWLGSLQPPWLLGPRVRCLPPLASSVPLGSLGFCGIHCNVSSFIDNCICLSSLSFSKSTLSILSSPNNSPQSHWSFLLLFSLSFPDFALICYSLPSSNCLVVLFLVTQYVKLIEIFFHNVGFTIVTFLLDLLSPCPTLCCVPLPFPLLQERLWCLF